MNLDVTSPLRLRRTWFDDTCPHIWDCTCSSDPIHDTELTTSFLMWFKIQQEMCVDDFSDEADAWMDDPFQPIRTAEVWI